MTIITKQGFCPACMMTKRVMDAKGIKYSIKHLTSAVQKAHVKDLGIEQYPIVEPNDKMDSTVFSGFHPEILNDSEKLYTSKQPTADDDTNQSYKKSADSNIKGVLKG